jgi:hypothetical protein
VDRRPEQALPQVIVDITRKLSFRGSTNEQDES